VYALTLLIISSKINIDCVEHRYWSHQYVILMLR